MIEKRPPATLLITTLGVIVTLLASSGCASRRYINKRIELSEARNKEQIDEVGTQVEETQTEFDRRLQALEEASPDDHQLNLLGRLPEAERACALQALERAVSAGDLSEGRIVDVVALDDATAGFATGEAALAAEARRGIDSAFARIAARGYKGLALEVQGHTDATGDTIWSRDLGTRRAESVAAYLREHHGFPADRIRVVSYGETRPIEPNDTPAGRAANRRVTLVAMR